MKKALSAAFLGTAHWLHKRHHEQIKIRNEQKKLAAQLSVSTPSCVLSDVMTDHGYNHEKQIGLMVLLDVNGVPTDCHFDDHQTANKWFKDITQENFLRGGERWSSQNISLENKLQQQKKRVLEAADILGMVSQKKPKPSESSNTEYIAILPGALESAVNSRISAIAQAHREGLSLKKVIAATGYRKLRASEAPLITEPEARTEANMMQLAWKIQAQKNPGLSQVPFELSVAELKPNQVRSTTLDTANKLADHPDFSGASEENGLLFIEQPYADRFKSIFEAELKTNDNRLSLYAKGLDHKDGHVSLFLFQDETARKIYGQYPSVQRAYKRDDDLDAGLVKASMFGNF